MARPASVSVENNFKNGYITEASGLNFPESACTDTENCVFRIAGNVERRLGIDFEANYGTKVIDRSEAVIQTYLWKNVAGSGTIILVVVQVGSTLYFYDASSTDPISTHALITTVGLDSFKSSGAPSPSTVECQFADGNGKLFVVHPYLEAFSVAYDPNTSTVSAVQYDILVRDFEGVVDGLNIATRPTSGLGSLSQTHYYNLLNQGWDNGKLAAWDASRTDMPSNCDIPWSFKNASDDFDLTQVDKIDRGNSPAPRGHFILSAFAQDRSAATGLSIADASSGYQRCSTVAFFAGRIFYSGINTTGFNSNIYFSQIIERDEQFGQCYQQNYPTSDTTFDLLPSDGGVIGIYEAGNIVKLIPAAFGLLVFAANGVWLISGSQGIGFTATDYTVSKISNVRTLTASSFVEVGSSISWWTLDGIYTLAPNQGGPQVQSLTEAKIKTFYNSIPPSAKRRASGVFNSITGIIQWIYRMEDSGDLETLYEATHILNLNVNTGAFYSWAMPESDVNIHATVVVENLGGPISIDNVVDDSGNQVVDDSGNTVVVYSIDDGIVIPKFKYLVSYPDGSDTVFTFAEERDTDYLDWTSYDGVGTNFDSYFITGYKIRGQGIRKFQSNFVNVVSKNDTATEFKFQGIWDYANTGNSGRWSTAQHVSFNNTDYDYSKKRMKVRGSGKVLQFKVSSVDGKPFNLVGWTVFETGNSLP